MFMFSGVVACWRCSLLLVDSGCCCLLLWLVVCCSCVRVFLWCDVVSLRVVSCMLLLVVARLCHGVSAICC